MALAHMLDLRRVFHAAGIGIRHNARTNSCDMPKGGRDAA
jgi:hypothetical protein